ncbi:hypothetical protein E2C01_040616 [Portunus trituberculatus]|uniref:Uncharacterized protein n=1 Tax=Portunus trituberculatus TaxID=210409 RepID=A0A5B7FMY7_PORTR|nr:hypothetical protein [Portunus trituberculatus]
MATVTVREQSLNILLFLHSQLDREPLRRHIPSHKSCLVSSLLCSTISRHLTSVPSTSHARPPQHTTLTAPIPTPSVALAWKAHGGFTHIGEIVITLIRSHITITVTVVSVLGQHGGHKAAARSSLAPPPTITSTTTRKGHMT